MCLEERAARDCLTVQPQIHHPPASPSGADPELALTETNGFLKGNILQSTLCRIWHTVLLSVVFHMCDWFNSSTIWI